MAKRKAFRLGKSGKTRQSYRWAWSIEYRDSHDRLHHLNLLECLQQADAQQEKPTKYLWLTNFTPTSGNVDMLTNQDGRLRWKIENEGFNVQKNGDLNSSLCSGQAWNTLTARMRTPARCSTCSYKSPISSLN